MLGKRRKLNNTDALVNNSLEKIACKGNDGATPTSNTDLSAKLRDVSAEASQCSLSAQVSLVMNLEKENKALPTSIINDINNTTVEKSNESPPYSMLNCLPVTAKNIETSGAARADINFTVNEYVETAVEKSIEPPPYSPLTPIPDTTKCNDTNSEALWSDINNSNALLTSKLLTETAAEKSVESIYRLSPLPLMSPETEKMFHVLADTMDYSDTEDACDRSTIASLRNGEIPLFSDSDDSVRDPNYCASTDCGSSDDSSNKSISLISGTARAEINRTPFRINMIASHQPDSGSLGPHGTQQEIPQVNEDEVILETAIISDRVSTNNESSQIRSVSILESESTVAERRAIGRPKKGRNPRYGGLSREERKIRKYTNLSYVNSRKKIVSPKKFVDFHCTCRKKCHENISVEKRLAQFNKFHSLGSYDAQNMFLNTVVKEQPVKRHYISTENKTKISKKKSYSRQYFLDGVLVCRDMVIQTLQTSAKRINTSLCKMRSEWCIKDNRGKNGGSNRASKESEEFVINFIKRLPTYISHYRREKTAGAKFLRADMTLSKIYELYSDEAKTAGVKILSASAVNKLFFTNFNLRTKPLKKDTCNKCDFFESQIVHASEQTRDDINQKRLAHQDMANCLQNQLKTDMKLAKDDPSVETITFDLQKTLPLPRIPTNIVFYKRQLWVYNLGIHTGSKDEAHCNVWVEGEAGRGAQEVGSCLIKHITERLNGDVKRLILWSDSCGGQNRNIKLTLMLKAVLNEHPTLDQINIRFLESGHSFLPNDTDFGKIECALKRQQRLYTPDDYIQVMKTCKKTKPMLVHRMKQEDFLSSSKLEKIITNRKKTIDGEKVSWLNTKEIMLKKDKMFEIYMKSNLAEEYKVIDIKKNLRGRQYSITKAIMEPLWPTGKPVAEAKINDLKSMLHLIPQDSHDFYVKLVGNTDIEEDIEGFSGQPDFEVE